MKTKQENQSSLMRLALLMKPHIGKLLICVICVIIVNLAELLKPYVAAIVIDNFLVGDAEQSGLFSITGMGILYFIVAMAGALFSMTQVRLIARISQGILNDMRQKVFNKIMHMPMKLLDRNGTGRLITRATNDVETVNEFYSDVFLNLFKDVFLLAGIMVMMFVLDAKLALVAMTGVPLIILITVSLKRIIKRNWKKMKSIIGQINGFMAENISGMRIVQAFNRQKHKWEEFRELNKAYFKTAMTQVFLNSFLRPTMEVVNNMVIALLIVYGCGRITGGYLEVGVLYAFTNYVKQFFEPINDLAEKYTTIQSALVSTDRIYEILDEKETEDPEAGSHGGVVKGTVEFKDVWFAYNDEDWILKGISFKVEAGQKIAFVGHTGVGKSTIINLISRYYEIQKGQILVDGIDIRKIKLSSLRRHFGQMLQDVFLFAGDIRSNILLHMEGVSDEEVMEAARYVNADKFIEKLPDGLNEVVRERGNNFSAGQRQLLSFARTIIHKPSVMILDEATANIDTETEVLIQDSLEKMKNIGTMLIVAHRLSTIQHADNIILLSQGKIIEQGNHQQLLAQKGRYHHLYTLQYSKQQLENS